MINIHICSIKLLKYKLQNLISDYNDIYCIINTSYPANVDFLNKFDIGGSLIEVYDDLTKFSSHSFNETIGSEIKDFIDALPSDVELYICCDEGISRSSAVACAVMRYLNQDEMKIWNNPTYHPNVFIYSILCNVFGFVDSDERLANLQKINNDSLANTINNTRK